MAHAADGQVVVRVVRCADVDGVDVRVGGHRVNVREDARDAVPFGETAGGLLRPRTDGLGPEAGIEHRAAQHPVRDAAGPDQPESNGSHVVPYHFIAPCSSR